MTPVVHEAALHCVPDANLLHPPLPLQVPSLPQPVGSVATQVLLGSLPPSGTATHTPRDELRLQVWQTPPQRSLQHTPCAQNLLPHSASLPHTAPCGFLPQEPARQVLLVVQSVLAAHEVAQRVPVHLKGVHRLLAGLTQLPPEHVLLGVKRLLVALYDWFLQTVPSG